MSETTNVRVRVHRENKQAVLDLFGVEVDNLNICAYEDGQCVTLKMDGLNGGGPTESDQLMDMRIPHLIYWNGDSEEGWVYDGQHRVQVSCLDGDVVVRVDHEGVYHDQLANAMKYFAVCQELNERWEVSETAGRFV